MNKLETAKVGDKLYIYGRDIPRIATITHITKTQVACLGMRFNRATGKQVGAATWYSDYARLATDEDIANLQAMQHRDDMLETVRQAFINKSTMLPTHKLERIVAIINE